MIILVSNTFATYKAQIRSSRSAGFKVLYTASCTSGADHAARAVVRKWYGDAAADTVASLKDPEEIKARIGDFNSDPKRKQVFEYFTFDDKAKASKAAAKADPAAKAAPITTTPALLTDSPREAAIRKHAETLRKSFRITVASSIALGIELLAWKEEIGTKHGGARGASWNNSNLKWPELVAQVTGFSYERCQDFMKAGGAVRKRFLASKKKGDAEVKLIVQSPPSDWTDDDYDAFASHVAEHFATDTFKALMLDLFPPAPALTGGGGGGGEQLEQGDFYQTMLNAHACIASPIVSLHRTAANPEQFIRHLYDLPLDDLAADPVAKRQHIHGLRTLQTVLSRVSNEIATVIKEKAKAKPAPVA